MFQRKFWNVPQKKNGTLQKKNWNARKKNLERSKKIFGTLENFPRNAPEKSAERSAENKGIFKRAACHIHEFYRHIRKTPRDCIYIIRCTPTHLFLPLFLEKENYFFTPQVPLRGMKGGITPHNILPFLEKENHFFTPQVPFRGMKGGIGRIKGAWGALFPHFRNQPRYYRRQTAKVYFIILIFGKIGFYRYLCRKV